MRKKLLFIAPLAAAGIAVFIVIGGAIVRLLWNWLLPPLLHAPEITFWQALGLLALCRILFGGVGGGTGVPARSRRRIAERLEQMTPEERERLRRGFHGCGERDAPPEKKPGD